MTHGNRKDYILKKLLAAVCAASMLALTGCSFQPTSYNVMHEYDFAEMELVQLQTPKEGDTIAVFDTSMGEIRVVLYPEYAPNTVNGFIEKVESGYYNGMEIFGIMDDMYFLSGYTVDEKGNYLGRQSDDELIVNECSVDLWPFKGALVSFSEKPGFSDARWFICNTETITEEQITELKESAAERENEKERENLMNLFDKFYEVGGLFGISGTYTVFGQTYDGLEVIEEICASPTNEENRPVNEIIINSVTIGKYTAEGVTDEA